MGQLTHSPVMQNVASCNTYPPLACGHPPLPLSANSKLVGHVLSRCTVLSQCGALGGGHTMSKITSTLRFRSINIVCQQRKMVDIVLIWIYLLSLFQPRIVTSMRLNRPRSLTFFACQQHSLCRSRGSLARLLFTSSLVVLSPFQRIIRSLRASRRFQTALRGLGFSEKNVCGLWISMGRPYPDWEKKAVPATFSDVQRHILVSLTEIWQVLQKRKYAFASCNTSCQEASRGFALASSG